MSKTNETPMLKSLQKLNVYAGNEKPEQGTRKAKRSKSREGQSALLTYHDPAVLKQLRILAAEQTTTQQRLVAIALNMMFVRYSKAPIAEE